MTRIWLKFGADVPVYLSVTNTTSRNSFGEPFPLGTEYRTGLRSRQSLKIEERRTPIQLMPSIVWDGSLHHVRRRSHPNKRVRKNRKGARTDNRQQKVEKYESFLLHFLTLTLHFPQKVEKWKKLLCFWWKQLLSRRLEDLSVGLRFKKEFCLFEWESAFC